MFQIFLSFFFKALLVTSLNHYSTDTCIITVKQQDCQQKRISSFNALTQLLFLLFGILCLKKNITFVFCCLTFTLAYLITTLLSGAVIICFSWWLQSNYSLKCSTFKRKKGNLISYGKWVDKTETLFRCCFSLIIPLLIIILSYFFVMIVYILDICICNL